MASFHSYSMHPMLPPLGSPALSPSSMESRASHLCHAAPSALQVRVALLLQVPARTPPPPVLSPGSSGILCVIFYLIAYFMCMFDSPALHKLLGTETIPNFSPAFSSTSCASSVLCQPHHSPSRLMVPHSCFSDAYPNLKSA